MVWRGRGAGCGHHVCAGLWEEPRRRDSPAGASLLLETLTGRGASLLPSRVNGLGKTSGISPLSDGPQATSEPRNDVHEDLAARSFS